MASLVPSGFFCRIFSVLFVALSISFQASAQSSQPQTISFQGFLSDAGGSALTDTLSIVFALYDSTNTSVWTETHPTVGVIDGMFSVRLGSVTPFQLQWNQRYELGVAVAGDTEMTPRTPLDSVPYLLTDMCPVTMVECTSGCVNPATDINTCGSCDAACASGALCTSGVCACPAGEVACASGCDNLATDVNNCGTCDAACASGALCTSGVCACPAGEVACASGCANLATDVNNCGSCDAACASGALCTSGVCACPAGEVACASGCANLATDVNNCGACGDQCLIGEICSSGNCQPS